MKKVTCHRTWRYLYGYFWLCQKPVDLCHKTYSFVIS